MIPDVGRATSLLRNWFLALAGDSGWDGGRILLLEPGLRDRAWKDIEESVERIFGTLDSSQVLPRLRRENQEAIDTLVRSQAFLDLSEAQRQRLARWLFQSTAKRQDTAALFGYAVAAIRAKCLYMLEVELFGEAAVTELMLARLVDAYIRACREYYAVLRVAAAPETAPPPSAQEKAAFKAAEARKQAIERMLRLEAPIDEAVLALVPA